MAAKIQITCTKPTSANLEKIRRFLLAMPELEMYGVKYEINILTPNSSTPKVLTEDVHRGIMYEYSGFNSSVHTAEFDMYTVQSYNEPPALLVIYVNNANNEFAAMKLLYPDGKIIDVEF